MERIARAGLVNDQQRENERVYVCECGEKTTMMLCDEFDEWMGCLMNKKISFAQVVSLDESKKHLVCDVSQSRHGLVTLIRVCDETILLRMFLLWKG